MHTVVAELCTGCDLCVPPCPRRLHLDAARHRRGNRLGRMEPAAKRTRRANVTSGATRVSRRNAKPPKRVLRRGEAARGAVGTAVGEPPASAPPAGASASAAAASSAPATDDAEAKKRAIIQAALERARKKKEELAAKGQAPLNTEHVSADVQAQIDAAEARRRRLGLADNDTANNADTDTAAADTPPNPAGTRNPR